VIPLIQKKTFLKDFENHKLRYTMKYGIFYKVFYSFELIIQLMFIYIYNYLQLIEFRSLKKKLTLPFDSCNIIYFAIL